MKQIVGRFFFLLLCTCACALVGMYGIQGLQALTPCPLCILQRFALWVIMLSAVIGYITRPEGGFLKWLLGFTGLGALLGLAFAARHVWLQQLPLGSAPPCTPGIDYLLTHFSILRALENILLHSGECAQIEGEFLGLSLAAWSLLFFSLITLMLLRFSLYIYKQKKRG